MKHTFRFALILFFCLCVCLPTVMAAKKPSADLAVVEELLESQPARLDISEYTLTVDELSLLIETYPNTELAYTVCMYDLRFPYDAEVIDFGNTRIKSIKELKKAVPLFPNLIEVDMYDTKLQRDKMEELWTEWPEIHWGWTLRFSSHTIRTDIEAFSSLHSPSATHYSSSFYEALKYCWQIKALDLGHNALTDISFIGTMKNLRVLILADNQIKDISPLANCRQLQYVELFMNRITDLSPLAGMPELLDLNLCHGSFVNIDEVYSMPKLQRLWVTKHKKMEEGYLQSIIEGLSDVEVYIDSYGSTGGTWREHERYSILYEMFQTYTYIPFSEV